MISFFNLTIRHPSGSRPLVEDGRIEISAGEFVEIIGPAGSGKSLLCSLMSLRRRVGGARCIVGGRNLDRLDARGIAELRQTIGSCGQRPVLLEQRSILENLMLPFVARGCPEAGPAAVDDFIEGSPLAERADELVAHLSQTQRKAVGMIRAMVGRPKLVVIDGDVDQLDACGGFGATALDGLGRCHDAGAAVVVSGRTRSPLDARRTRTLVLEAGHIRRVDGPATDESGAVEHVDVAATVGGAA